MHATMTWQINSLLVRCLLSYNIVMSSNLIKSVTIHIPFHQENPLGYIDRCLKIGNYIVTIVIIVTIVPYSKG